MTLTEFLLACIAEDEREARALIRAQQYGDRLAAAQKPDRILVECAAKRRIVEHAQRWALTLHETPEGWTEELTTPYRMAMRWTLEQLAQPYSGHPDFGAVFGD